MIKKKYTLLEVYLLATAFGNSPQTISRWINKNDDRLTSEKAKKALLNRNVNLDKINLPSIKKDTNG